MLNKQAELQGRKYVITQKYVGTTLPKECLKFPERNESGQDASSYYTTFFLFFSKCVHVFERANCQERRTAGTNFYARTSNKSARICILTHLTSHHDMTYR